MNSKSSPSSFIQLITVNSFGKLVINSAAIAFIRTLPPPISIASIIGPRSTGKSFLVKQIATQFNSLNDKSFSLEPTNSIWISSKPLLGYNQQGKISSILLLDSPGFGIENEQTQSKLLAFLMLLSNCIFYNTLTQLSAETIPEMNNLLNLFELLPQFSRLSSKIHFHWIIRDFNSKVSNQFGTAISSKQYLQNFLLSFSNTSNDQPINLLKMFLPKRDCHFLIKPDFNDSDQHPLFCQQVIHLRKCLTDLPSFDIQGTNFILLLQTYIDALNNNDSLEKVFQQGQDCLTRIRCLERLNNELKSLEQQSMNSIEGIDEKLLDIKGNLNEYFKQRMMSSKQISALDEELAEIFQDFKDMNQPKVSLSKITDFNPHLLQIRLTKPQKMVRYSLNISEEQVQRPENQYKPLMSLNRITPSKAMQSRLEQYEAKIFRYELQTNSIKNEALFFKQEYQKSKKELQYKQDELQEISVQKAVKEKTFQMRIQQLEQTITSLQKQNLLALSENEKLTLLTNDKISYLQNQLAELSSNVGREREEREEKYRSKINQYVNQISEINKAHDQQISQLKLIYKSNIDKIAESTASCRSDRLIKTTSEQSNIIEELTDQNTRYRSRLAELQNIVAILNQKIKAGEEKNKIQLEKVQKRGKEVQLHLQDMYSNQMVEKQGMINVLQDKNNDLLRRLEEVQNNYHKSINQSNYVLGQLKEELTQKSYNLQSINLQVIKLKPQLLELQSELQMKKIIIQNLQIKNNSINNLIATLQQEKVSLQTQFKSIKSQQQKLRYQTTLQIQRLNSTIEIQAQQYQNEQSNKKRQIQELKQIYQIQKQGILSKMQQLMQQAESGRQYKYLYQQLHMSWLEQQSRLTDLIIDNQTTVSSLKSQLLQAEEHLSKNQQHIRFLTNSITTLNQQYSNNSHQYSSQMQELQRHSSEKINSYVIELSQSKSRYLELQKEFQKAKQNWLMKQKEYQKQLIAIVQKNSEMSSTKISQNKLQKVQITNSSQTDDRTVSAQKQKLQNEIHLIRQNADYQNKKHVVQLQQTTKIIKKLQDSINTVKSQTSEKLNKAKQSENILQQQCSVYENDRAILLSNIQILESRHHHQQQKSQNYLNLLQRRMQQSRSQNQKLIKLLQQYKHDYEQLKQIKNILQSNYNRDRMLWAKRIQYFQHNGIISQ